MGADLFRGVKKEGVGLESGGYLQRGRQMTLQVWIWCVFGWVGEGKVWVCKDESTSIIMCTVKEAEFKGITAKIQTK